MSNLQSWLVYTDTPFPFKKEPEIIIHGLNSKEALKSIFPIKNWDIKKGVGNKVNIMLTPVYIKEGKIFKSPNKRRIWYLVTFKGNCMSLTNN